MGDRSLYQFLDKLDKQLNKSSEVYRAATSNKQTHDFGLVADQLVQNTIKQVRYDIRPKNLSSDDIEYLTGLALEYYNDLRMAFTTKADSSFVVQPGSGSDQFRVIISPKMRRKKGAKRRSKTDVFKTITNLKQKYQKVFYDDLAQFYITKNRMFDSGAFLDVTHQGDSAVSKQQVQNVAEQLKGHPKAGHVSKAFMDAEGVDLSISKTDTVIRVSIGDAETNRKTDAKEEQGTKAAYKTILSAALEKEKKTLATLKGSDSFKTSAKKKATKKVMAEFSKLTGVKVTIKDDIKPKKSKGKKVTKKIRPKVTSTPIPFINDLPEPSPRTRTKESPVNLQALIPVINARLTDVVAGNMGSPALNYQTGRFARSVKVTDITTTRKGFPSIGYTYMKDPYQLYESPGGSPTHATPERDPRLLIGKSIREIATGLIQQRFYTRRN